MVDDEWGRRLADRLGADHSTTVSIQASSHAQVWVDELALTAEGSTFLLHGVGADPAPVVLPVLGEHNVANAAVAAACCHRLGVDAAAIAAGLADVVLPVGRVQPVPTEPDEPRVFVDYAHTPQGVRSAVVAGRSVVVNDAKVIAVLGAGGDRDASKRADMGEAAAGADVVVVTSDNPRSEDPAKIAAEVAVGARRGEATVYEHPDRRNAIGIAIDLAEAGVLVMLLGKGHERTLEQNGKKTPFNDFEVAQAALEQRRSAHNRK